MVKKIKKGKIRFYDSLKEFGFIVSNEEKEDIYFSKRNLKFNYFKIKKDELCFYVKKYNKEKKKHEAEEVVIVKPIIPQPIYNYLKNENLMESEILKTNLIENFNLLLNRYALFNSEKFFLYYKDKKGAIYKINSNFSYFDFEGNSEKYKEKLKKLNIEIKSSIFKPDWRFVVGLGNPSVYETSITLHHIYGFPYIPGSAVKGIVRAYFIQKEFEKTNCKWEQINIFENILENLDIEKDKNLVYNDKERSYKKIKGFKSKFSIKGVNASENLYEYFFKNTMLKEDKKNLVIKFQKIFGTQSQQGKIIFFDAYPQTPPKIKVDIMNPHYSDYYSGKKDDKGKDIPPADYLNPNPIHFLTVEDTEFEFFIGTKKINGELLKDTMQLLYEALEEHGIGAKTAVGYGYFK